MISRAEQVLSRVSHQKAAAEIRSLTGRMVAIENPQSTTNINRVLCQAGLLFQQQRRLDDPNLSAYIRGVLESRLVDSPTEPDPAPVKQQLTLLTHQTLVRLASIVKSAEVCLQLAEANERKQEELKNLRLNLERLRSRHNTMEKCDALAKTISANLKSTQQVEIELTNMKATIEAKQRDVETVRQISEHASGELSLFAKSMRSALERLQMTGTQLKQLADTS